MTKINCFGMTFSNQCTWTSGSPSSAAIQTVSRDIWLFRRQSNEKLGSAVNEGNGYEGGRCHEASEANQHVCASQSCPYSLKAFHSEVSKLLSNALLLPGWRADTWHAVNHRGANNQKWLRRVFRENIKLQDFSVTWAVSSSSYWWPQTLASIYTL